MTQDNCVRSQFWLIIASSVRVGSVGARVKRARVRNTSVRVFVVGCSAAFAEPMKRSHVSYGAVDKPTSHAFAAMRLVRP